MNKIKWISRVSGTLMFLFFFPFYIGYGNPLPFVNPEYTWIENAWLTLVPIVLIGFLLGWKFPKTGGYMIVSSIVLSLVLGLIARADFSLAVIIFLLPGIGYLVYGYKK